MLLNKEKLCFTDGIFRGAKRVEQGAIAFKIFKIEALF